MATNPLLERSELPDIKAIMPAHIVPAIKQVLANNRTQIQALLQSQVAPSWESLAQPMEELSQQLHATWSAVSHLHGVQNTPELREAYDEAQPLMTAYGTELGQNRPLFEAYNALQESDEYAALEPAQRKAIDNTLRDFKLSGVALADDQKQVFAELQQQLAGLSTQFANNVLDATQHWQLHLPDDSRLQGVPDAVLQSLRQQAQAKQLDGYLLGLDMPCYLPLMQYASDRNLREELYRAYSTRASDQGPDAGRWDNSPLMQQILEARRAEASLLGYANYAELSLATKMAEQPRQVLVFLQDLAQRSRPQAQREYLELCTFAAERDGLSELQAWDVPYYSELLRQQRYAISEQELRPYFPAPKVIGGMFEVAARLFGVRIEQDVNYQPYQADVSYYRIYRGAQQIASFYLDPYAREAKRGGAWMADCRNRYRNAEGELHLPIAFLVCNFSRPEGDKPALLTHNELCTLFHEFGHGLHHMLSEVEVAAVSGINGVAWDAVELPSQFLENWCWQEQALAFISGHFETGEPLPQAMLDKLLAARNFQSGMMMMRQLEFALFDLRLHLETEEDVDIQGLLDQVRAEVAVVPVPTFNRFQHGFAHIFAGGYAAGYYSYKWAELLSADAFARFEEEGIFNRDTGASFAREILEAGGSREAAECFRGFRGREPDSEALLRHSGIIQ